MDPGAASFFDEMFAMDGHHRGHYGNYWNWLQRGDYALIRGNDELMCVATAC